MLKIYMINGQEFQYEEGEQPECAVELRETAAEPPKKEKKPANKARKAVKTK